MVWMWVHTVQEGRRPRETQSNVQRSLALPDSRQKPTQPVSLEETCNQICGPHAGEAKQFCRSRVRTSTSLRRPWSHGKPGYAKLSAKGYLFVMGDACLCSRNLRSRSMFVNRHR